MTGLDSPVVARRSSLLGSLRKAAATSPDAVRPPEEIEREVAEQLDAILEQHEQQKQSSKGLALPTFFKPKPKPSALGSLIYKQAKQRKEQVKQEIALDESQLQQIWFQLEEFSIHDADGSLRINYDGFSQVATRCREIYGPSIDTFFRASVFEMFEADADGCISANLFAAYLTTRSNMHHMRVHLSYFDEANRGDLNTYQLEEYIRCMIPELPPLEAMQPSFVPHYKRIAARKLLFFHGKNGVVRIKDLVNSAVLQELMELKMSNLNDSQLMGNWFSMQSTRRVYNTFDTLDDDANGFLSRQEFSAISNGTMSPLFIKRIFEEHIMRERDLLGRGSGYKDEMDLVAFTDFVLAWDHRSHPAAIKYFFDIFDLQKQGYISPVEIYTFFKEIHVMWVDMGEYAELSIYDVVDEILDMIKPKNPPCITADDLAASGLSGVFFSILSDVKQFYDYNYRENLLHQDDDNQ